MDPSANPDPSASTDPSANAVSRAIDGATGDWSMSGDAMRWSPELAEAGPVGDDLRGVDLAAGLGAGLGIDVAGVRRLVSGALSSLGTAAGGLVEELRQLTRGSDRAPGRRP